MKKYLKRIFLVAAILLLFISIIYLWSKHDYDLVNIEDITTITTVINQNIYEINKLDEGSKEILEKINLKENSYWIKYLNREPEIYKEFETRMKELYHERVTDKVSNAIDQIDLINGVLMALK